MDADVIVVGVGTMGAMAAWRAASRGVRVIGIEQFGIGHDQSAAGGESRQFRDCLLEPEVLPMVATARGLYQDLERASGRSILLETGGITIGADGSPLITMLRQRAGIEGVPLREYDSATAAARHPMHRFQSDEVIIEEDRSGVIRPEVAITSAVDVARDLGADIRSASRVTAIEERAGGVTVRYDGVEVTASTVIVTAGPWSFRMLPDLAEGAEVRRVMLTWYPVRDADAFSPAVFPTWTRVLEDGMTVFGVPVLDGFSTKVASVEMHGDVGDPDALDRSVRLSELAVTNRSATRFLRGVGGEPVRTTVHMEGFMPDGQPLVGLMPGSSRIVVGAGFSGRGFKMATSVGELLAALALDGGAPVDLSVWDPARFSPAA